MSEYRQNLTTGQWVIIATERAQRPEDFTPPVTHNIRPGQPSYSTSCPFCVGGDADTARASVERLDSGNHWKVRIIPNKYASVSRDGSPKTIATGKFVRGDGYGVSDVVIESPLHNTHPALMSAEDVTLGLEAMRSRFLQLTEDPALRVIHLFRNHGPRAGASLLHPHSQIISTSIVPPHISSQIRHARKWHASNGMCVYCANLAEELRQRERIVAETEHFVAWCPFASRSPFETRIQPKRHVAIFGEVSDEELVDLGRLLKEVLGRIQTALFDPDYNYVLRSATVGGIGSPGGIDKKDFPYYHWYMVIIPKVSRAAGMELGTGIYINPVAPEVAASILRSSAPVTNGESSTN